MYLHSLQVENYRAIRKGKLTFDESVAIIGENESGKTSLLEALGKVLNSNSLESETFEIQHFYHNPADHKIVGPIRISLFFQEGKVGEWSTAAYKPLHQYTTKKSTRNQLLILELKVLLNNDNSITTSWLLKIEGKTISDSVNIIQWIRQGNPLILLSAGMLMGRGIEKVQYTKLIGNNTFPPEYQKHISTLENSAISLLSPKNLNFPENTNAGYKAALKLNEYMSQLKGFSGIQLKLGSNENRSIEHTGSNSEKIGAILITYALIRACQNTSLHEVDPIWVLEDPETHLHKMTLAAVSNIINSIKGQKIITTNSGGLLATIPLLQVRRLIRKKGIIHEYLVKENTISQEDIRRINYHVRTHRNSAFFSRLWLLVEGETEFWMLPRLARILGYDFRLEGITCVEFAQSGLRPLLKVAQQLNIQWHMLTDGDRAGYKYANQAIQYLNGSKKEDKICVFPARDIEQYLWQNGFSDVYIKHSRTRIEIDKLNPSRTIKKAIRNYSKPHLALSIIEAAAKKRESKLPMELVQLIENCVRTARNI